MDNGSHMAKSKQMLQARQLRKEGESIKVIAKKLIVSVSSVSMWCRDIELSKEQIDSLKKRVTNPFYGRKRTYIIERKKIFDEKVRLLKEQGKREIGHLSKRDIFIAGIALYWGEGFKKDHLVGLATSDPGAARFFILWLYKSFGITKKELVVRVTANISHRKRIQTIEQYWAGALSLQQEQFSKSYFQKTKWRKEYENKDEYHGVIRIKVRKSVNLLRKIFGYLDSLSNPL